MNLERLDIVLHIGYHKTGTTFFQKKVFSTFDNVLYIGRSWVHKDLNSLFYDLSFTNALDFDSNQIRKRFYKIVEDIVLKYDVDISSKKMILISHESLHSGSDYFGSKIKDQAHRIHQTFPKAKIIISIRNQIKMIESHYTNFIHHGGKQRFKYFYNESFAFTNLKSKLNYNEVVSCYLKIFGKASVHVLVFEHVFLDPVINLNDIIQFLDLNTIEVKKQKAVNKRMSKFSISVIRVVNCFFAKDFEEQYNKRLKGKSNFSEKLRWFLIRSFKKIESSKLFPKPIFSYNYLNENQKNELLDHYFDDNFKLSSTFDLKLELYGYYPQNKNK